LVAILSAGTLSRAVVFQSSAVLEHLPDRDSLWWLPVEAAMGNGPALALLLACGASALAAAIRFGAPRFGELALAAGSMSHSTARPGKRTARFRARSPGQALRHKEWLLLLRDPWLMSQSLMQLLYLLPPFFSAVAHVLWRRAQRGAARAGVHYGGRTIGGRARLAGDFRRRRARPDRLR